MSRKDRLARAEAEHGSAYIIVGWRASLLRVAASEEDAREAALTAARQEHDYLHGRREGATTKALDLVRVLRVPFNTWVYPGMDGELIYGREHLTVDGREGDVWRRIGAPLTEGDRAEVRRQAAIHALDRNAGRPRRLPRGKVTADALAATSSWVWTERPIGPLWDWKVAVFPTGEAAIAHTRRTQPIWGLRRDGAADQFDGRGEAPLLRYGNGAVVR